MRFAMRINLGTLKSLGVEIPNSAVTHIDRAIE